ncbi:hypothetical protein X975_18289, partial [Stegodyphus mimosarum]
MALWTSLFLKLIPQANNCESCWCIWLKFHSKTSLHFTYVLYLPVPLQNEFSFVEV